MTFHIILAISAFMMVLLGTRIAILAMRARRESLGYHSLTPQMQKLLPTSIQGGGIVLVFAIIICTSVADIRYGILLPVLLLTSMTLLEKLIPVPWLLQMMIQIIAIAFPLSTMGATTFGGLLTPSIDYMVTGALWLWFINMYSNMDRLDGLSISGMISICAGLYIAETLIGNFQATLATYSLIMAAAGCGFLWWNWSPAKISFGRIGSVPIGFLMGYLLLLAIHSGFAVCALILPAYFISDSVLSWLRHTLHNTSHPAGTRYYYMQALRHNRKPLFVVKSVMGMNILLIFLGTYSIIEPELKFFNLVVAYLCVFMLLGFFADKHTTPKET